LRDQKSQARGKGGRLEQATATAAESCHGARKVIQNLSRAIKRNREKIDNRSRQRDCALIRPMNKASTCSHRAAISGTK